MLFLTQPQEALCHEGALLAHVHLGARQDPQTLSAKLLSS